MIRWTILRGDLSVTPAKYGHVTCTIPVWYALHVEVLGFQITVTLRARVHAKSMRRQQESLSYHAHVVD